MPSASGGDRHRLLGELEQARNELRAAYRGLSEDEMTRPGAVGEWTVRDVLTHVASWEELALPDLGRLARGDTAVLASLDLYSTNYDTFNDLVMSLRRNLPVDQVLRELDVFRSQFMAAVGELPDAALKEGLFGRILVQITAEHDKEHAGHILGWRRKEGL